MINAEIIGANEKRELQKGMKERYGAVIQGVMYWGSNERIYLSSEYTALINLRLVNAEGVGIYIGRMEPDGFRPSIEGAQLLQATKNVYEITKEQAWDWIRGFKIEIKTDYNGYCILTYNGDVLGAGKISNGHVWNYTPKERRVKNLKGELKAKGKE